MEALILAAGRGQRMSPLTDSCPKPLLKIGNETLLARLIHQFYSNGVTSFTVVTGYLAASVEEELKHITGPKIRCVRNSRYEDDINIYSVSLGLRPQTDTLIIESDLILTDSAVSKIVTASKSTQASLWFACGPFRPHQLGGVLKADAQKQIRDIRIVPKYEPSLKSYRKLLGIMKVGHKESALFCKRLQKSVKESMQQYYLIPWIKNLATLPAKVIDIGSGHGISFNTPTDYKKALETFAMKIQKPTQKNETSLKITFVPVAKLRHIEGFSKKRVEWLRKKILKEGIWNRPIVIDSQFGLVMDGQHRFEVARALKLKHIPCVAFNYHDVEVWSLRKNHEVNVDLVIKKALEGDIYPYKTVKHRFPGISSVECEIDLAKLMKGLK